MRPDLGIDIENLNPEMARAYGLAVERDRAPLLLFLIARFLGWIGIGFWLGGLVVIQYIVTPQSSNAMAITAPLLRKYDWQARAASFIVNGSLDMVCRVALGILVYLVLLAVMERRGDARGSWQSWMPLAVTIALGAVFVYSQNLRFDSYTSSPQHFQSLVELYNALISAQIVLLVCLTLALVWVQTANASSRD